MINTILSKLDQMTTIHRELRRAHDEENNNDESQQLLKREESVKAIFKRLCVPVKWNEQTESYEFDIDCSIQEYMGYE